ncbi:L-fucose:H+ symporter permease [Colwellia sp. 75C3]|uniref:L-fucose:H+ symporter permease n=1 Tax=Colwellia sp. 75C3 TaxID=888425 RepID=UPI000C31F10F|nr:L-fucose:H+ symporter permease [Colwellia sp. 75C3]PKG81873.1 L-fucose:H+ symporter permease [Colwellia sp. 75C3]
MAVSGSADLSQFKAQSDSGQSYNFTLVVLTSLFFMWGFIACLNDILIPHLKNVFSLNYTQAMLIQFCFFSAYFIVSMPAAALIKKVGYKFGIVSGLSIAGIGCVLFYPAAGAQSYPLFLFALFVLASGITCLQVSANPYVASLGRAETASSRLNLTQAFNSLGTTVAPFFGGLFILSAVSLGAEQIAQLSVAEQAAAKLQEAQAVQIPYLVLAGILFGLAAIFTFLKLPKIESIETDDNCADAVSLKEQPSAWKTPHLMLGALGIFVYVGAEVSIGSFLISFLGEDNIAGLAEAQAANYIAYYWGGAMVGRFIGAALMRFVAANKILTVNAISAVILLIVAITSSGQVAMWAILSVGLCNSIMFPTIFTLAVNKLGKATGQGSGILCLSIAGGALIPLLQGVLADAIGIQMAFVLPVMCYLYIMFYGVKGSRIGLQ